MRLSAAAPLAVLTLAACLPFDGMAQGWPREKPIRLVVDFGPGSSTDTIARLVQPKLTEALGQSVAVENKPGAGGNIAAQQVKRTPADGYTLLVISVSFAVNPSLYANAGYDPIADFAPVALGASTPNLVAVHPSVGATNLPELIDAARKTSMAYASSGIGTTTHLSMERL